MEIKKIQQFAISNGLSHYNILKVIDAIESKQIDKQLKFEYMKCLIPKESIPEEAFTRLTCIISDLQFSTRLKVEILKWMITVHFLMVKSCYEMFRSFYEMYLQLLKNKILCPYICHFLSIITCKEDLTQRRVDSLHRKVNDDDRNIYLILLLRCYYKLGPEFFYGTVEETKEIECEFKSLGEYPVLIKHIHPQYKPAYVVHVTTRNDSNIDNSGELEENLFHDIFYEFQHLIKSNNISQILKSKYRRLFLTSNIPSRQRVAIADYITTKLYLNFKSTDSVRDILEIFHDTQRAFIDVLDFTIAVPSWSERKSMELYTALLQYQPIYIFEEIHSRMDFIREKILKADVPAKCRLFYCLSKMYENWILTDYNDYLIFSQDSTFSAIDKELESGSTDCTLIVAKQINEFGIYMDLICNILLLSDSQPCLLNQILLHYERVSKAHMQVDHLVLLLPTMPVFHMALFSLNYITLNNLGRLMLRYNAEIMYMQKKKAPTILVNTAVKIFNMLISDICKLFYNEDYNENYITNLSNMKVINRLREKFPNFEKHFCLTTHPALFVKRKFYRKDIKSKKIPVCKLDYQQYLFENGLASILKLCSLKI